MSATAAYELGTRKREASTPALWAADADTFHQPIREPEKRRRRLYSELKLREIVWWKNN